MGVAVAVAVVGNTEVQVGPRACSWCGHGERSVQTTSRREQLVGLGYLAVAIVLNEIEKLDAKVHESTARALEKSDQQCVVGFWNENDPVVRPGSPD